MRICRLDAFLPATTSSSSSSTPTRPPASATPTSFTRACARRSTCRACAQEFDTAYTPMLPELIETLLDAYAHVRARAGPARSARGSRSSTSPARPSVPEFRIICAAAQAAGIDAPPRDARGAHYDGSTLRVQGEPVQLVYRRALLEDLDRVRPRRRRARRPRRASSTRSARASPTTRSCSRSSRTRASPTWSTRRRGRGRSTPRSRGRAILRPGRVTYGDWVIDLLAFVADNRERLVLKPASDYGGHGVSLGMETEQADWERIIEAHAERADFIVQEYVPVPEEMFPTVEDGHVADAPQALQHQPLRHRRPLRRHRSPVSRTAPSSTCARAADCCPAWSGATSAGCSPRTRREEVLRWPRAMSR